MSKDAKRIAEQNKKLQQPPQPEPKTPPKVRDHTITNRNTSRSGGRNH